MFWMASSEASKLEKETKTVPFGKVGIVAGDLWLVSKGSLEPQDSSYLRGSNETTKPPECIVKHLLCDHGIQVAHEQLSSHFHTFLLVG